MDALNWLKLFRELEHPERDGEEELLPLENEFDERPSGSTRARPAAVTTFDRNSLFASLPFELDALSRLAFLIVESPTTSITGSTGLALLLEDGLDAATDCP